MRVIAVLISVVLVVSGCKQQVIKEKRYLNVDSLISSQIDYLSNAKASLTKEAAIGDKTSVSTTLLDSTSWSHELDVFRQLDLINRPTFRDAYVVTDRVKDAKSNLLIRSYEAPAGSPVPYLRLYYMETPLRLKRLEAFYQETNSLYRSQRKLAMYFEGDPGKPYLKSYSIEGDQKLMLSDSVHYTIQAKITL